MVIPHGGDSPGGLSSCGGRTAPPAVPGAADAEVPGVPAAFAIAVPVVAVDVEPVAPAGAAAAAPPGAGGWGWAGLLTTPFGRAGTTGPRLPACASAAALLALVAFSRACLCLSRTHFMSAPIAAAAPRLDS